MTLDEDKAWVLWPEYFDRSRPRSQGRKVKRSISVSDPTVDLVARAVRQLGLAHKVEREKSYPGNWYSHGGRVLVERSMPKSQLLLKVGDTIIKIQRS